MGRRRKNNDLVGNLIFRAILFVGVLYWASTAW